MKATHSLAALLAALTPLAWAGEFKVEKKPFQASVSVDGTFLPDSVHPLQIDSSAWADFTIEDLVPQGGSVKKGEPVVTFDTEAIDKALADDADATKLRKLALQSAERELSNLEKTTPWRLDAAERNYQRAKDDYDYFKEVGRPLEEETAQRNLQSTERYLESATEELKQLLKMYKEDDLTEETEEIILKRQRYQVEAAEFRLKTAQLGTKRTLEVSIPRQAIDQDQAMKDAELSWATQREALPRALEQKRLEVKKARIDDERADEKSKELKADRAQMNVPAPVDGRVYFGEIEDGRWNPANAAKFMKVSGKIPPKTIFATVIPESAKLQFHAFVDENAIARLQTGQAGFVAPAASPRARLQVAVKSVDHFPAVDGKYHLVLEVQGAPADFQLVPGMKGQARINTGDAEGASIVIPANALHEDTDGSYYVEVKAEDGAHRKVPVTVGAESGGNIVVLSGLQEGQVVVTHEPKPAEPAQ